MANGNDVASGGSSGGVSVSLSMRPERRLIRPGGSHRYVDFHVQVVSLPAARVESRSPLNLALVIDRSGSMSGDKIATAKRAALSVVDRLDDRDRMALVVFDDQIDVVQSADPVTPEVKARVRAELARIQARGSTNLRDGWLIGCQSIAGDNVVTGDMLSRCFLLTDGLANVGETDPERIATEAAGVLRNAGISTSTFGIGEGYDEGLLGPMAVAGSGQFHNLQTAQHITETFVGELGSLLDVAATRVTLELRLDSGLTAELISTYRSSPESGELGTITIPIGDLLAGEDRHLVVRLAFPAGELEGTKTVKGRLSWGARGRAYTGDWTEAAFRYASDSACTDEPKEPEVMHWVGIHMADRAQWEAAGLSRKGDFRAAGALLRSAGHDIRPMASADPEVAERLKEVEDLQHEVASGPMSAAAQKELYAKKQRMMRGQQDYRTPKP